MTKPTYERTGNQPWIDSALYGDVYLERVCSTACTYELTGRHSSLDELHSVRPVEDARMLGIRPTGDCE